MNQTARLSLVDRAERELSITAQCQLLKLARSTLYYRPSPVSADDLRLMRRLDEQYLATPFYGARRMVAVLRREGWVVNRKRLMQLIGIEAIYQKPNTSRRHPEHKVYPYLLGLLEIEWVVLRDHSNGSMHERTLRRRYSSSFSPYARRWNTRILLLSPSTNPSETLFSGRQ